MAPPFIARTLIGTFLCPRDEDDGHQPIGLGERFLGDRDRWGRADVKDETFWAIGKVALEDGYSG